MSIPGHATSKGTEKFKEKFAAQYAPAAYNRLGRTDLTVSQLGFGAYRCHVEVPAHKEALKVALQQGCNLIDTSANYTDGNAEALIGEVLNREIVWGELKREHLIVVSKAGYIQGENMEIALEREKSGRPFPETVKYQEGLWHCIHPDFIEDQITRSLARMHLDVLDVYLLHNPEYFLSDAAKSRAFDPEKSRAEFYRRIRQAFLRLEKLADEGLIRHYGISSNSFPLPGDSPGFVSLARVWEVYEEACREMGKTAAAGRFAVIQLPFNWLEHQAATLKNNEYRGGQYTVLELAEKLNLGVLANRPLNAIYDQRVMLRLARYGSREGVDYYAEFEREVQALEELESAVRERIGEWDIDVALHENRLSDFFRNAPRLRHLARQSPDVSQFRQLTAYYGDPLVSVGSQTFIEHAPDGEKKTAETLAQQYLACYQQARQAWLFFLDGENYQRVKHLEQRFDALCPQLAASLGFSQKALLAAAVPGVHCVLNGMRTPEYVADSMKVMEVGDQVSREGLL